VTSTTKVERLAIGPQRLPGELTLPPAPLGVVVFAHGSGSSRLSPRNQHVAQALQARALATLLFDLLTDDEAADRRNVFDIALLASRLGAAIDALRGRPAAAVLPVGLFGASTGAAAALVAAADRPDAVAAVVSRGGRPDLAGDALPRVRAPTLLIVGGADREVLELNDDAARCLRCAHELAVVPGATHLFEEAGALERVAALAADWFAAHLAAPAARA
jgi:pimeloyl-ACP methyl ester carboxylesterase